MAMTKGTPSVPNAGGDAVPGGYPAPTPHLANVEHEPYTAPTSVPAGNPPAPSTAGYDALENGLGDAKYL